MQHKFGAFILLLLFAPSLSFGYTNRAAEKLVGRWKRLAQNELRVSAYPKALWWLKLSEGKESVLHSVLEQQKSAVRQYMAAGLSFFRLAEWQEAKMHWTIALQLAGGWWPTATEQIDHYLKELKLYENR